MITGADLATVGFEWYEGSNAGDPYCEAYYQKFYDKYAVEVTFYRSRDVVHPNLKIVLHGGLQEQVDLIGVPAEWDVAEMEAYCQRVVDAMTLSAVKHGYERVNGVAEMLKERVAEIENGTAKTLSWEEFKAQLEYDRAEALHKYLGEVDKQDDEEFERLLNEAVEMTSLEVKTIANKFTVSRPTVERWMSGTTSPHPAMRPLVYRWLQEQLDKKYEFKKETAS